MPPLFRPGLHLCLEAATLASASTGPRLRIGVLRYPPRLLGPRPIVCNALYSTSKIPGIPETLNSTSSLSSTPSQSPTEPDSAKSSSQSPVSSQTPPSPNPSEPAEPSEPSDSKNPRLSAAATFSTVMDNLQTRVLSASQTLNSLTGYVPIEKIKATNADLEARLADTQRRLRAARQSYKTVNTRRATTQRDVTTLLARKDAWSPADLERFTILYRDDHTLEAEVAAEAQRLTDIEEEEQRLSAQLNAGILKRYHEEQIWSDRIRRASTWGTWGLMGVNILMFIILQFIAEPWKRRRLVKGVVEEEKVVLEEVRSRLDDVVNALERSRTPSPSEPEPLPLAAADAAVETAPAPETSTPPPPAPESDKPSRSWQDVALDPNQWPAVLADLSSDRRISLRMRDATLLIAEGALAGAVTAASVAYFITR